MSESGTDSIDLRALWSHASRPDRAALLCAAVGALLFLNSLGNGFAFDDNLIIVQNQALHGWSSLWEALGEPYWPNRYGRELGLWRPVTTGMFGSLWILGDGSPFPFHLVAVLLHAGATWMVVRLLAGLLPTGAALVGGLLFALHPVHVEAVANVVGMAEVLSTVFVLAACLLHLGAPADDDEPYGTLRGLGVAAFFVLGFLTKESAVTVIGLLFLIDMARRDRGVGEVAGYLRARGFLYLLLLTAAVAILLVRWSILGNVAQPFAPLGAQILHDIPRIWTVASTWPHYVRLLFFPLDLSADYSPQVIPIQFGWTLEAMVGVFVALSFLALTWVGWRGGRRLTPDQPSERALGFGAVWFVIAVSPVSNVVFLSGVLLAERTFYLPSVGFAAAAGWAGWELVRRRRRLGVVVLAGFLVFSAVRSWTRTPTWQDNDTVFGTLMAEQPESGRAQWVLGDILFGADRIDAALRAYRVAVGALDSDYIIVTGVAGQLMEMGAETQGETLLLRAWREYPQYYVAPALLAVVWERRDACREAAAAARSALVWASDRSVTHHILSRCLERLGDLDGAVRARRGAIESGEGERWQQWLWLAELHLSAGDTVSADVALDSARVRAARPLEAESRDTVGIRLDREAAFRQIDSLRAVIEAR